MLPNAFNGKQFHYDSTEPGNLFCFALLCFQFSVCVCVIHTVISVISSGETKYPLQAAGTSANIAPFTTLSPIANPIVQRWAVAAAAAAVTHSFAYLRSCQEMASIALLF